MQHDSWGDTEPAAIRAGRRRERPLILLSAGALAMTDVTKTPPSYPVKRGALCCWTARRSYCHPVMTPHRLDEIRAFHAALSTRYQANPAPINALERHAVLSMMAELLEHAEKTIQA
jgi:hypothetical protein